MSDIVERLRTLLPIIGVDKGLMLDAADEIERLTAARERLKAALEEIAHPIGAMQKRAEADGGILNIEMAHNIANNPEHYRSIARRALADLRQ